MSGFKNLSEYKNNIIYKLISDEDLVKALAIDKSDFLDRDLPNNFSPASLVYDQIFPYPFNPDIEDEPKSFITMLFGGYRYVNNVFKGGVVTFYILSHRSLLRTDYGLRYDFMLEKVDGLFNQQDDVGIFKAEINGGGDMQTNSHYFGSQISYRFMDFQ